MLHALATLPKVLNFLRFYTLCKKFGSTSSSYNTPTRLQYNASNIAIKDVQEATYNNYNDVLHWRHNMYESWDRYNNY